jgi:hypothetical protein
MKHRRLVALPALLLSAMAGAQPAWTLEAGPSAAALLFGAPETVNAFRLDCSAGTLSLSTWTTRRPRNVSEGAFPTRLRVFQGRTELDFGATGRVLPAGGTRVDALVGDPATFLAGVGRTPRFVVVTFQSRAMAPAPTAAQLADFGKACLPN